MLAAAFTLSRIGTVHTVWFAFIITEVTVAAIACVLMLSVYRSTVAAIPELSAA